MSETFLSSSRYASSSARTDSSASSAARGASAATTMKVAPCRVSGRVVNTVTWGPSSIWKSTWAPSERPIQLRCIASTRSGQWPVSWSMSSSRASAYSVMRKYHWFRVRLVTSVPQRSQRPSTTCSFASTVWSCGHQLTGESFR